MLTFSLFLSPYLSLHMNAMRMQQSQKSIDVDWNAIHHTGIQGAIIIGVWKQFTGGKDVRLINKTIELH